MRTAIPHNLHPDKVNIIVAKAREAFVTEAHRMQIDKDLEQELVDIYIPLAAILEEKARSLGDTLVAGVNGAQGAGKSTLCRLLQVVLEQGFGLRVACFSIDDIYHTAAERTRLARQVHPLLATRGVPGTHDVDLGLRMISELKRLKDGQQLELPLFNKAIDDRYPQQDWRQTAGPVDLILFEGWCVGARPQNEEELVEPVNILERREDPERTWRRYVNRQLQEDYSKLFAELDFLIMLKVPDMQSIMNWRSLQEQKLAATTARQANSKIMSREALERFIMHYERLTRAMLDEMPKRAQLVLELNAAHQIERVGFNP